MKTVIPSTSCEESPSKIPRAYGSRDDFAASYSPLQLGLRRFYAHRLAFSSFIFLIALALVIIALPLLIQLISDVDYKTVDLAKRFQGSTPTHLLGTDELGRDVFIRLLHGGRISLMVAFVSSLAALIIGTTIGAYAGYYGGMIDTVLMRFTDAMLALPTLPLMILLAAIDLNKIFPESFAFMTRGNAGSIIKLMIIVVFFGWMTVARLVRGEFLSLKEREFVQASLALGVSSQKIIWRHLLPNCLAPIIVAITLSIGSIILYEAILSFIGLGIQPPIPSWGNMLHQALEYIRSAPLLAIYPGIIILLTVVSINFIGDGLRDAFDPRFVA